MKLGGDDIYLITLYEKDTSGNKVLLNLDLYHQILCNLYHIQGQLIASIAKSFAVGYDTGNFEQLDQSTNKGQIKLYVDQESTSCTLQGRAFWDIKLFTTNSFTGEEDKTPIRIEKDINGKYLYFSPHKMILE